MGKSTKKKNKKVIVSIYDVFGESAFLDPLS